MHTFKRREEKIYIKYTFKTSRFSRTTAIDEGGCSISLLNKRKLLHLILKNNDTVIRHSSKIKSLSFQKEISFPLNVEQNSIIEFILQSMVRNNAEKEIKYINTKYTFFLPRYCKHNVSNATSTLEINFAILLFSPSLISLGNVGCVKKIIVIIK